MTQNDPPQCADHFEVRIVGGDCFCEKIPPLRGAGDESSLECLDQPLWAGLSREPLSQPPLPPLLQGARTPPLCDSPSGCCPFTGPWTVTRSSLRMLRRVAAFCRPLRPVLLLVSFPRSRSPVVGVPGLCWMWRDVPFARQRRPVAGVLRMCWLLPPAGACANLLSPSSTHL